MIIESINNIYIIFIQIFIAFFCCYLTLFFSKKFNFIDRPDGLRKKHHGDVSLGGGAAVYVSIMLGTILLINFNTDYLSSIFWIFFFSTMILLMGFIDDIKPLPVSLRLIIQIIASWGVIFFTDLYVSDFGNLLGMGNIDIGIIGIPLTIFMVVGVCNAFNMLDGMDGLVSFTALISFGFISYLTISSTLIFLLISISMAIFLLFNLGVFSKRSKMFLGDSGSMWIGFILAWFLVFLTNDEEQIFRPVIALLLIPLPIIDAIATFLGRIEDKKPIFYPDRSHIHHILLDIGISKAISLTLFIMFSMICVCFAFFAISYEIPDYFIFYIFLTLFIFYLLLKKDMQKYKK
tara:strand:- start:8853 stop:9896 length:1044 start_codon:yes stop_codon:yes gene_type:complete